ncbi:hypothetical protein RGU12_07505 [Fredinandcohnia sp. QZ13]|uniref:hypothetical protein n=1 Tax=Fredinandcohnia sp. QZ13 TaxID=3073144 RepID=UPI0028532406|nr:hypothetical protein [Fredinandcohnia sp. QZ13]MDR4887404.1 hypothetical protein [Fredinandcohnia sp. QZ13]
MDIMTLLGVTVITGVLSIMAFYFSFSKKAEGFYEETNESPDATGFFLIVGWILMGLHKLYKITFRTHHTIALRITLFIFGTIFLVVGVGIWFLI